MSRFVSAFNYVWDVVNFDVGGIDPNDLHLANTPAPAKIRNKLRKGYAYSVEYDALVNSFGSANEVAESITSRNRKLRQKSLDLMRHPREHIYKGIGWYLSNGNFIVENKKQIMLVGKQETMSSDIQLLLNRLELDIPVPNTKVRENKNSRRPAHLSQRAIRNLLRFYHNTDYAAVRVLEHNGFIDRDTVERYSQYVG